MKRTDREGNKDKEKRGRARISEGRDGETVSEEKDEERRRMKEGKRMTGREGVGREEG